MRIHIGAGNYRLAGFLNMDIQAGQGVDIIGHAGDLSRVAVGSVEMIFSHAVFEHLFVGHQTAALREWRRVLAPGGTVVIIGVPDFAAIAHCYVSRARGILGPRFDLYNVYRYTHGVPEVGCQPMWNSWKPDRNADAAPPGWLPQLHKALFDAGYLHGLVRACGFDATVFNYAFPGEEHALSLGCVATVANGYAAPALTAERVTTVLAQVQEIGRFVNLPTVRVVAAPPADDLMFAYLRELASASDQWREPSAVASAPPRVAGALER